MPEAATVPVFSRAIGSWELSIGRRPFARAELAGHYDRKSAGWQRTIDQLGFEAAYAGLLSQVPLPEGPAPRVLDAGTGTGAMAAALRRRLGRRYRLTGVDISPAMLRQAEARLGGEVDLTLRQADLTALPFDDESFDMVLAAHVLEHLPDPETALRELHRVLKPGGLLVACMTRRTLLGRYIQLLWRTHRVSPQTAKGWFARAGFVSVRAIPFAESVAGRLSCGYAVVRPARRCRRG